MAAASAAASASVEDHEDDPVDMAELCMASERTRRAHPCAGRALTRCLCCAMVLCDSHVSQFMECAGGCGRALTCAVHLPCYDKDLDEVPSSDEEDEEDKKSPMVKLVDQLPPVAEHQAGVVYREAHEFSVHLCVWCGHLTCRECALHGRVAEQCPGRDCHPPRYRGVPIMHCRWGGCGGGCYVCDRTLCAAACLSLDRHAGAVEAEFERRRQPLPAHMDVCEQCEGLSAVDKGARIMSRENQKRVP